MTIMSEETYPLAVCTEDNSSKKYNGEKADIIDSNEEDSMLVTISTSVLSVNNVAVSLSQRNRFQEASEALQIAHERLEILMGLQNAVANADAVKKGSNPIPMRTISLGHIEVSPNSSGTSLETVFTFFNRAFVFPDLESLQQRRISFACPQVQSQIRGAILFNLALCYHNMAIRVGSSQFLSSALRLYERSYAVVREAWEGSNLEGILLLLMALFNNMGHIHSNTFDMERTRHCMSWLQSAIAWKGSATLEGDAYFFFFKNISYIPLKEALLAPAA